MDALEEPHFVTDPVDSAPPQKEPTGETVWGKIPLVPLYLGMAATRIDDTNVKIGVSILDDLYTLDYFTWEFTRSDGEYMSDVTRENTIHIVVAYSISDRAKYLGAGATLGLKQICPGFCAYISRRLDIVCVILKAQTTPSGTHLQRDTPIDLDEQADLAARECVRCCAPGHNPALALCFRNKVMPDAEGAIRLVEDLQQYKETVHESTWKTVLSYANELMGYKDGQTNGNPQSTPIKIALLSTTPQGGGVYSRANSEASRITKTNNNILQGVADPEARFDKGRPDILDEWMRKNAEHYWLSPGGHLAPGGADLVIIDDPQMPALIPLIKTGRPEVEISYRSHIEVREDLVAIPGSPQRQWRYAPIAKDVIVVRIGPSDQMSNAMITPAKIVVQLALREGFAVKIEDGKSGFLVEVGDTDTVADRLFELYTNDDLYARMSKHAKASVSDEVGTVGNAACWLYLAAKLARGEGLAPNTGWIMDMARAEVTKGMRF
ncbi:hypothetical protein HOY80DRAFT_1139795 [Tuber brumale]|nr:hypothetical protein HOY80DRAFT_1139795 [Tuber brumale]